MDRNLLSLSLSLFLFPLSAFFLTVSGLVPKHARTSFFACLLAHEAGFPWVLRCVCYDLHTNDARGMGGM